MDFNFNIGSDHDIRKIRKALELQLRQGEILMTVITDFVAKATRALERIENSLSLARAGIETLQQSASVSAEDRAALDAIAVRTDAAASQSEALAVMSAQVSNMAQGGQVTIM